MHTSYTYTPGKKKMYSMIFCCQILKLIMIIIIILKHFWHKNSF